MMIDNGDDNDLRSLAAVATVAKYMQINIFLIAFAVLELKLGCPLI